MQKGRCLPKWWQLANNKVRTGIQVFWPQLLYPLQFQASFHGLQLKSDCQACLWILEGHRNREVGLSFITAMKLMQTPLWSKNLCWKLKEMSRRLVGMVLGFSSFSAEEHYFRVEERILKFLWRHQTHRTEREKCRTQGGGNWLRQLTGSFLIQEVHFKNLLWYTKP